MAKSIDPTGCAPTSPPVGNRLLQSLPGADFRRIEAELTPVCLDAGQVIHHPHDPLGRFYFIESGFVSLLYTTADGHTTEIALVGPEGGVGESLLPGQAEATAQVPVKAWSLPRARLREEFARGGSLHDALLCFSEALMAQMAQTAVCNCHHTITLQLCRWLLLSLDRMPDTDLPMTHDTVSHMLGVRRAGITEALSDLYKEGIVESRRGHVRVVDRHALEIRVCECYGVVRDEYDRLYESL